MVSAVHYFATLEDHAAILDYLGEPVEVTLHPWPVGHTPAETWTRERALAARHVMVVHRDLGPAVVIRAGDRCSFVDVDAVGIRRARGCVLDHPHVVARTELPDLVGEAVRPRGDADLVGPAVEGLSLCHPDHAR